MNLIVSTPVTRLALCLWTLYVSVSCLAAVYLDSLFGDSVPILNVKCARRLPDCCPFGLMNIFNEVLNCAILDLDFSWVHSHTCYRSRMLAAAFKTNYNGLRVVLLNYIQSELQFSCVDKIRNV